MMTMAWPLRRVSAGYIWQETYPALAGAAVFAIVFWKGEAIACSIALHKVELSNVYTAVGGIFAIITGFLATFYGSIQSIVDTRLKRISKTGVFLRFIRYIKIATKCGFAVALLSIPYLIFSPSTGGSLANRTLVAAWCGACIFGLAAFVRVAGLLFFIFEYQPPEDNGAG
jgi:hypothetical protein